MPRQPLDYQNSSSVSDDPEALAYRVWGIVFIAFGSSILGLLVAVCIRALVKPLPPTGMRNVSLLDGCGWTSIAIAFSLGAILLVRGWKWFRWTPPPTIDPREFPRKSGSDTLPRP